MSDDEKKRLARENSFREPDRKRSPHARYRLTWYDFSWNEMSTKDCSAHEALTAFEEWNRHAQREAKNDSVVIMDQSLPIHLAVEVLFV